MRNSENGHSLEAYVLKIVIRKVFQQMRMIVEQEKLQDSFQVLQSVER